MEKQKRLFVYYGGDIQKTMFELFHRKGWMINPDILSFKPPRRRGADPVVDTAQLDALIKRLQAHSAKVKREAAERKRGRPKRKDSAELERICLELGYEPGLSEHRDFWKKARARYRREVGLPDDWDALRRMTVQNLKRAHDRRERSAAAEGNRAI